jgi:hypothetical protein
VSRFLGRVGWRSHRAGRVVAGIDWTPGRLFVELEGFLTSTTSSRAQAGVDGLFLWCLIGTNIILAAALATLLYHAVAAMYVR